MGLIKVGILSDTHVRKGRFLPSIVWENIADADLIMHAGDIGSKTLLEDLELIAPVVAVRGNGDFLIPGLPEKKIHKIGGLKVGLVHGDQGKGKNALERAYNTFRDYDLDLIIFGHSHIPIKKTVNGLLLFNPGSPTVKRGQKYHSLGILTIQADSFDIRHVYFP